MDYGNYPDLTNIKRILVIKLRQLGDVLVTTPLITNLQAFFPEAEIDLCVYKDARPLLEENPDIHLIHIYDQSWKKLFLFKRRFREWQFLKEMRNRRYDLVMNLTDGDRGAIISKFSKARVKLAFDPENKGFWGKNNIYTHIVKHCPQPRHSVNKNLDALRRIGLKPKDTKLILQPNEEVIKKLKQSFDDFVLIHPTARWRYKCLPKNHIRELIETLLKRGQKVVVTGGTKDFEIRMVNDIVQGIKTPNLVNLGGQINLQQLIGLIHLSKVLVCMDSLPLHIASALQVRNIVFFGPTSEKNWGPWLNPNAKVIKKNFTCRPCALDGCGGSKIADCLVSISVDEIMQNLEEWL